MKGRKKGPGIFLLALISVLFIPNMKCMAHQHLEQEETNITSELMENVDFSEIDGMLEDIFDNGQTLQFSDVVLSVKENGFSSDTFKMIGESIKDALLNEISDSKKLLLQIVLIAIVFSILKNFVGVIDSPYISNICFGLVYFLIGVMLLQSFSDMQIVVQEALQKSIDFMKALIPTYCITLLFSSNVSTSASFYQMAFLVIYMVEWLFVYFLLPMIHIYVVLVMMNHFLPEERFANFIGLCKGVILWGLKMASLSVLGLNVVQNLISPAKDRLTQGTIGKAASVIPAVGNAVNGIGEIVLGAGIVVKNCVGVAGLLVILVIGVLPCVKVMIITFFYKLAAALVEPVSDKRIAGCLSGMTEGAVLYLKLLGQGLLLFFLTIALTTAATSYIY